jgi:group I intron endonuclease
MMPICSALLKYGYSSFKVYILEYCEKENLIQREQYYFDRLNPNYNICKTAGSTLGRKHSEETKEKLSPPPSPPIRGGGVGGGAYIKRIKKLITTPKKQSKK